jgi:hypothetical protein
LRSLEKHFPAYLSLNMAPYKRDKDFTIFAENEVNNIKYVT